MADPVGIFDENGAPLGWFDETAQPGGWFDESLVSAAEAGAGSATGSFESAWSVAGAPAAELPLDQFSADDWPSTRANLHEDLTDDELIGIAAALIASGALESTWAHSRVA